MSQTILITGTSTGFGNLIAQTSASKGHMVIATMRGVEGKNKEQADELIKFGESQSGSIEVLELDVASDASVKSAIDEISSKHDQIDVLVNNAGIGGGGLTEGFTVDQFEQIMNINVTGVHRVTKGILPIMRKKGAGLIINISSVMGRVIIPFATAYTTSKYALEGYSESLRYELKGLGIDVSVIEPGGFGTNFFGNMLPPADTEAVDSYGAYKKIPEKMWGGMTEMFSSDKAPNPQEIADAVDQLVEMEAGTRPARVVVDPMSGGEAPTAINKMTDEIQKGLLASFGMEDAL